MRRLLATVEYNGTNYFGWEKQVNVNSIQENIEKVISKILNTETHIYASGRTDKGVHALGQTFHFDVIKEPLNIDGLKYSINCLLREDIQIVKLEEIDSNFSARIDVKEKIYEYRFSLESVSVFNRPFMIEINGEFSLEKLKEASELFKGEHYFKNFTTKEEDEVLQYIRNIYDIKLTKNDNYYALTFSGNGFMRYMVRFIVGTMIAYAIGKIDLNYIKERLDTKKDLITNYKAPAKGLFLKEVKY